MPSSVEPALRSSPLETIIGAARTVKPHYRPDIDGLRAVAVLAVMGFHYGNKFFSGGFIGVDIFFVISGYLLSSIVITQVEGGAFKFTDFYARRIRRILPALFALFAFCTAVAWFFLLPQDLLSYSRSMLAATLSGSNFLFWKTSSYFDVAAANKPLLHTWSLAVEEQFYVVFPILIVLLHRYFRTHLRRAIAVLALASFAWSVIDLRIDQTADFYLPFSRMWELLAGTLLSQGLVRVPRSRAAREILAGAGILILGYLIFSMSTATPFPGQYALLPCLATCAIILAGTGGSTAVNRVLSWRPVVFVGLISYSLYLWHWPLLVFSKIAILRAPVALAPQISRQLMRIVAFILAALSWRFVEQPFRAGPRRPGKRAIMTFGLAGVAGFCVLSAAVTSTGGVTGRFSAEANRLSGFVDYQNSHPAGFEHLFRQGSCFMEIRESQADFNEGLCLSPVAGKRETLIFGDSNAANLQYGLEASFPDTHFGQATRAACPPTLQQRLKGTEECRQFTDRIVNGYLNRTNPPDVILMALWQEEDLPHLAGTIAALRQRGVTPIVFGPFPRYADALPHLLAVSVEYGDRAYAQQHFDPVAWSVDTEMNRMATEQWHVPYVSMVDLLCPQRKCVEYAAPGTPLQFDTSHLTLPGSLYVGNLLKDYSPFTSLVGQAPRPAAGALARLSRNTQRIEPLSAVPRRR